MRLNETEMVKLLPAWMQEDGSDKGLATGCDIISRDAYARLKLLSRWDKIDQLNDAELDEMAWELNIQWYDSTAPIAVKRAVIRSSDRVYTIEGNTSDQVARRSYYLSDSYIVGYGRPAYDAEPGNTNAGSQTPSSGTTSEVTYTVVAGDTLSKIAAKYGTTYQKLAAYNGITNPNIIRVGQKIKIPGTAATKKTNAEIAKEVIAGKWGNGADRKKRLEAAGYDYNAIQQAVNAALAR